MYLRIILIALIEIFACPLKYSKKLWLKNNFEYILKFVPKKFLQSFI